MTPEEQDAEKKACAEAAALLVEDGMLLGLGTGSTVAFLLPAIARRGLRLTCVATSPRTAEAAIGLGLTVVEFDTLTRLDLAIDGADQIAPDNWLIKGGGAAHTREKIVEAAADRFVVIADSSKVVNRLVAPVPVELVPFGLEATLARLGDVRLRDVSASPDGGIIGDSIADIEDPYVTAARLSDDPGVVSHGLFPPSMVSTVIIARGQELETR
jgi:ribose 5-phosphate isomerase A